MGQADTHQLIVKSRTTKTIFVIKGLSIEKLCVHPQQMKNCKCNPLTEAFAEAKNKNIDHAIHPEKNPPSFTNFKQKAKAQG